MDDGGGIDGSGGFLVGSYYLRVNQVLLLIKLIFLLVTRKDQKKSSNKLFEMFESWLNETEIG